MVSENEAPSSVTNKPMEAAPGIPAVEVDPTNELLDGENLDEKKALLDDPVANVKVDPSGRRLEDKDAAAARQAGEDPLLVIPPPAAANLEVRKRADKFVEGVYGSYGADKTGKALIQNDSQEKALEAEKEGLQRRADGGDEKAAKRVGQVDEQLTTLKGAAQQRQAAAGDEPSPKTAAPKGRSAQPPKQDASI